VPITPPLTITEAEMHELIRRLDATLQHFEREIRHDG